MPQQVHYTPPPRRVPQHTLDRVTTELSVAEKKRIFRGMVIAELDAGFLRYSKRQALLKYAARLGLGEFDACLLIAEAQFHSGDLEPIPIETVPQFKYLTDKREPSISLRMAFILGTAAVLDLIIVCWLFP